MILKLLSRQSNLLREQLWYHWGNLDYGKKADPRSIMGGRSTGHFGTGFYFVSEKTYDNNKVDYERTRPIYSLDPSSYNLLKLTSNSKAHQLHDALKLLNNLDLNSFKYLGKTKDSLLNELDDLQYSYDNDGIIKFIQKYNWELLNDWDVKDAIEEGRWGLVEDYAKDIIDNIVETKRQYDRVIDLLSNIFNKSKDEIISAITYVIKKEPGEDSLSTLFIKKLGYEGVDVSQLSDDGEGLSGLDNFTYGSVIYDLKPNTFKKIMDPRL